MKTNNGQRRILAEQAAQTRHEMYADDVLAMCDDMDELAELIRQAIPHVTDSDLQTKLKRAVRV